MSELLLLAAALAAIAAIALLPLAATRALGTLLFGVAPADPLTYLVVPVLLLAVGMVASWLPARRASLVDPMEALRAD